MIRYRTLIILITFTTFILLETNAFSKEFESNVPPHEEPSGTINISAVSRALILGTTLGAGTLKFQGKEYRFIVEGLSILNLGEVSITASGEVYNLENLSDFVGIYTGEGVAIAVFPRGSNSAFKNQHGVKLKLNSTRMGFQLKLAPEGFSIFLYD